MEPRFDPEFIRNMFSEAETYNEDLRGRLASSPVFELATRSQRDFQTTIFNREQLAGAWVAVHSDIITVLNKSALDQGVMHENVTLRGEGIRVPKFDVDFAANVALLSLIDKEKQQSLSFEAYLNQDEHKGKFAGFTLHFVETDNEEEFVPVLAYRVSMQPTHSPHSHIALFSTGDVGITELHFDRDERLEGAVEPLNTLFEKCLDKADSINRINVTLAGTEKYDASIMRHVGYHAEKVVKDAIEPNRSVIENALADLISNYVDNNSIYEIRAKKVSLLNNDDKTITLYESDEGKIIIKNKYLDIVFRDYEVPVNGEIVRKDKRSINIAFAADEDIAYIPLLELDSFEKQ